MASQDRWRQDEREQRSRGGENPNRTPGGDWNRDPGRDWDRDRDSSENRDRNRDYVGFGEGRDFSADRDRDRNRDNERGGSFGAGRDRAYGSDPGYGAGRSDEWGRQGGGGYRSGSDDGRPQGYGARDRDDRNYGYSGGDRDRSRQGGQERSLWDRATDEVSSWFGDQDAERRREEDHRGRGPKGYTRSDDRIRDDLNDRLADDRFIDASDIEVQVAGGEVTLTGQVANRAMRRQAEDLAEKISGVSYVQNNLRVRQPGSTNTGSTAGASSLGAAGGSSSLTGIPGSTGTATTGGATTTTSNGGTSGTATDRTRPL